MKKMEERDRELETTILKESILSVSGLNSDMLQIGLKGDPSLRETTYERKKYSSSVDTLFDQLSLNFQELFLNRSTYRLYIGFNNGEIRTTSVFDPFRPFSTLFELKCIVQIKWQIVPILNANFRRFVMPTR